jgi:hypothetical protein
MGTTVAILLRKQRDIVEVFEGARATSPATARDPYELGIDNSMVFRGLVQRVVLREAGDGRYYVDEPSWRALHDRRRRASVMMLGIVAAFVVLGMLVVVSRL